MPDKFQNKYRIASARAHWWDYGKSAPYFVTVCTKKRKHFFGNIIDSKMILSETGKLVEDEWLKTPGMRPDMNLKLGEFVVMPNHFHAIIIIGENKYNTQHGSDAMHRNDTMHRNDAYCRDAMHCVSTGAAKITKTPMNKFGPQSKNLASIMRGFKIAVSKNARLIDSNYGWQFRYNDHIIRNEKAYQNIERYIINNPANWKNDRFYGK